MNNKLSKSYNYRDYTFIINIELEAYIERSIDGERRDIVSAALDLGKNNAFTIHNTINSKFRYLEIEAIEHLMRKKIDEHLDGIRTDVDKLIEMGFEFQK